MPLPSDDPDPDTNAPTAVVEAAPRMLTIEDMLEESGLGLSARTAAPGGVTTGGPGAGTTSIGDGLLSIEDMLRSCSLLPCPAANGGRWR